jgi:hypothetical protein
VKGTIQARRITVATALAVLAMCTPAAAAPRLYDLDALRGAHVQVASGVRLADAGAVIAATFDRRAALVRLRHDGTVVDAFGHAGIAHVGARGESARAVTSGPGGRRIVVAVRDAHGATQLLGFDGHGRPRPGFGPVPLTGSGPVALAARGSRVAVATGQGVAVLDARTGVALGEGAGCGTPRSAVLAGAGRLLVACGASIAVYHAATAQPAGSARAGGAPALVLGLADAADVCVAEQVGERVRTRRADPATVLERDPFAGAPDLPAPDRLTGLAPDPRGGCNLLLAKPGSARVVQTDAGGKATKLTTLPGAFRPKLLFVCHSHVLTAGVRHEQGRAVAALAIVKRDDDG